MRVNEALWAGEGTSAWLQVEEVQWLVVVVECNAALWSLEGGSSDEVLNKQPYGK